MRNFRNNFFGTCVPRKAPSPFPLCSVVKVHWAFPIRSRRLVAVGSPAPRSPGSPAPLRSPSESPCGRSVGSPVPRLAPVPLGTPLYLWFRFLSTGTCDKIFCPHKPHKAAHVAPENAPEPFYLPSPQKPPQSPVAAHVWKAPEATSPEPPRSPQNRLPGRADRFPVRRSGRLPEPPGASGRHRKSAPPPKKKCARPRCAYSPSLRFHSRRIRLRMRH